MALVDNACFGMRASGNLGDLNYYISRGRQIARARKTTSGTPTAAQIVIQGYLSAAVTYWTNTLTATQRQRWVEYARSVKFPDRLGRYRCIPAYNLFIKMYIRAKNLGTSPRVLPPTDVLNYGFDGYYCIWVGALNQFRVKPEGWFSSERPDGMEWWYAGPFDSENRTAQENEFYFDKYWTGFSYKFGSVVTGSKWYWHRIRWTMADGRHGNWIQWQAESA